MQLVLQVVKIGFLNQYSQETRNCLDYGQPDEAKE